MSLNKKDKKIIKKSITQVYNVPYIFSEKKMMIQVIKIEAIFPCENESSQIFADITDKT